MSTRRGFVWGLTVAVALLVAPSGVAAAPADVPWGPLRHLDGRRKGAIDGRLGTGEGMRDYEFVTNRWTRLPVLP